MRWGPDSIFVEVGVDQGRSASVLLHAARIFGASVYLIDSWESVLIDNLWKVQSMAINNFPDVLCHVINKKSVDAAREVVGLIDLIHIDANHYDDNPAKDCEAWLPKLRSGGVACFHDYGATFPAVTEAVDKYTAGWEDLGIYDGLAIRRKP